MRGRARRVVIGSGLLMAFAVVCNADDVVEPAGQVRPPFAAPSRANGPRASGTRLNALLERLNRRKSPANEQQMGQDFGRGVRDTKLTPTDSEALFLERLMAAESGGRLYAKNPASSAVGPFQFLSSTFLDVMRRNFSDLVANKSDVEILALRTDYEISRNAALVYTRENASALAARGKETSPANLRLAFFAGASAALRVLEAEPEARVSALLSKGAIAANPFLRNMRAADLLARAARDAEGLGASPVIAGALGEKPDRAPKITVRCNLGLASCRRWLALAQKRLPIRAARLATPKPN